MIELLRNPWFWAVAWATGAAVTMLFMRGAHVDDAFGDA